MIGKAQFAKTSYMQTNDPSDSGRNFARLC
jgi:hypothetical protein